MQPCYVRSRVVALNHINVRSEPHTMASESYISLQSLFIDALKDAAKTSTMATVEDETQVFHFHVLFSAILK